MVEYQFYAGDKVPPVSTYEFHEHRARAPHLDQPMHRARLLAVARTIREMHPESVTDLGCGDGGLLSLIRDIPSRGYDFQPANMEGWTERQVTARALDFVAHPEDIVWGELTVITEVLEHLADPHGMVELISRNSKYIVASSPYGETAEHHAEEHAWGWDMHGYQQMFSPHWIITSHFLLDWCQILAARSKYL